MGGIDETIQTTLESLPRDTAGKVSLDDAKAFVADVDNFGSLIDDLAKASASPKAAMTELLERGFRALVSDKMTSLTPAGVRYTGKGASSDLSSWIKNPKIGVAELEKLATELDSLASGSYGKPVFNTVIADLRTQIRVRTEAIKTEALAYITANAEPLKPGTSLDEAQILMELRPVPWRPTALTPLPSVDASTFANQLHILKESLALIDLL